MNAAAFEMVLERRIMEMRKVLSSKAAEYANEDDRLHNFKRAAAMLDCTPQEACLSFMTKHLVSITDMVQSNKYHAADRWDEKIGDAVNYLVLLEAILLDQGVWFR